MVPRREDLGHGDTGRRRDRPGSAGKPTAPAVTGDAALLALHRTAGNAAVTTMIQRLRSATSTPGPANDQDAHVHGAGCEHDLPAVAPVQRRLAVHDVLGSAGRPMESALQREMEQRFDGKRFDHVRMHTGEEADRSTAELGAEALTSGHHIVLSRKAAENKHVIAHELWHTEQQSQGRVEGSHVGGGISLSDPSDRHEREAETVANDVMSDRPVSGRIPVPAGGGQHTPRAFGAIQRAVTMHVTGRGRGIDFSAAAAAALNEPEPRLNQLFVFLLEEAGKEKSGANGLSDEEKEALKKNQKAVEAQLEKWTFATPGTRVEKSHPLYGSKQQKRSYNSYSDFARALLGWVGSKENRHREKELAQKVKGDSDVEIHLETLFVRIRGWIESQESGAPDTDTAKWKGVRRELETGISDAPDPHGGHEIGHYQKFFDSVIQKNEDLPDEVREQLRTGIQGGMWKVLVDPEKFSFRDKIIVLHDLMEYFGTQRHWNAPFHGTDTIVDQPGQGLSTTAIDKEGKRIAADGDRGQEVTRMPGGVLSSQPSTRRESAENTRLARRHHIPVWAGSSFTAMRMLNVAKTVGGTLDEISAVAWGTFAFWRLDYDHTSELAYHPLHEVMDIAQNFGIPYNMLNREKDLQRHQPGTVKRKLLSSLTDVTERLDTAVQEMDACLDEVRKRLQEDPKLRYADSDQVLASLRELAERIDKARSDVKTFRAQIAGMEDPPGPDGRKALRRQLDEVPKISASLTGIHDAIETRRHDTEILLKQLEVPEGESASMESDGAVPLAAGVEEVVVKRKKQKKGRRAIIE